MDAPLGSYLQLIADRRHGSMHMAKDSSDGPDGSDSPNSLSQTTRLLIKTPGDGEIRWRATAEGRMQEMADFFVPYSTLQEMDAGWEGGKRGTSGGAVGGGIGLSVVVLWCVGAVVLWCCGAVVLCAVVL